MFVEHKEQGEAFREHSVKLKPSEAIRLGKAIIVEEKDNFQMCGVGCAFAGVHGRQMTDAEYEVFNSQESNEEMARAIFASIGFHPSVGERIHELHFEEKMPALEIANILEFEGL